eukprot:scaffold38278_cov69-Phaeocystis_antarctica.AAC.3
MPCRSAACPLRGVPAPQHVWPSSSSATWSGRRNCCLRLQHVFVMFPEYLPQLQRHATEASCIAMQLPLELGRAF